MKSSKSMRLIFISIFAFLFIAGLSQQPQRGRFHNEEHQERIQSMKVAFITERLSLTPEEAQQFWPVYNQYQEEMKELREKYAQRIDKDKSVAELDDEEVVKYVENQINRLAETAVLKRKYHEKFLEIIPVRKVALLYEAEKDFNRRLFREMRRRQKDNGRGR